MHETRETTEVADEVRFTIPAFEGGGEKQKKLSVQDLALESFRPKVNPEPIYTSETLKRLFADNYEFIRETASLSHISVFDIDNMLWKLEREVSWFVGPDDDAAFCEWVTERLKAPLAYHRMRADYEKVVYAAIWSVVDNCADLGADLGDISRGIWSPTVQAIANLTWIRIYADMEEKWLIPGTAKLSTRLFKFAKWQAKRWKQDQIRERDRLIKRKRRGVCKADNDAVTLDEFDEQRELAFLAEAGKLPPRPVVLGPDDIGAFDEPARQEDSSELFD